MYVAKVNDRGKASCAYMFDEQLVNFDEMFSKSYFMKKSTDKQSMIDFSHEWNKQHKDIISKNDMMYYANVVAKGILQAPALVILYSCIVMGAMLLFGSGHFYEQINLYGVEAFGNIRTVVTITYVVCAVLGLLASLTTYNNVFYKFVRCIISILTFLIVSPVIMNKVFFATSSRVLTLTVIAIVGLFFVRFLLDRLIVSISRKNTEKLIRAEHIIIDGNAEPQQASAYAGGSGAAETVSECSESAEKEVLQPIMDKVKKQHRLTQYKRN